MAIKRKVKKAKRKVKRKTKRATVTIKRKVKRTAVKEGEIVLKREESLSLQRIPTLADVEEMVRRSDKRRVFARKAAYVAEAARAKARAELLADPKYEAMVKQQKAAAPVAAACKPENRSEALAWLHTIAEHIRANLEEYRANRPPVPVAGDDVGSYAAARMQRDQMLADIRRLWWFVGAVKVYGSEKNKKSLEQLLGLTAGRGHPVVQDRRAEILQKLLNIVLLREPRGPTRKAQQGRPARPSWKEIGRTLNMSPQAARKLYERESSNLPAAYAKEIAARLKRKPPSTGGAKARSAALGKQITARNRAARSEAKAADSKAKRPTAR